MEYPIMHGIKRYYLNNQIIKSTELNTTDTNKFKKINIAKVKNISIRLSPFHNQLLVDLISTQVFISLSELLRQCVISYLSFSNDFDRNFIPNTVSLNCFAKNKKTESKKSYSFKVSLQLLEIIDSYRLGITRTAFFALSIEFFHNYFFNNCFQEL
jgi:hypothetical protein